MSFTAPLVLLGIVLLPGLYLLLRLTPPAPRRIVFPPVALLRGLPQAERSPARMPLWLLLLRLLAAALVILGLAGPSLHPPPALPGAGPVLLVVDNGWAAAPVWGAMQAAGSQIIAAAAHEHRGVALLATARGPDNAPPAIQGVMAAHQAEQTLAALVPHPWAVDRGEAAQALGRSTLSMRVYLADGITDGPGFTAFWRSLHPNRIIAPGSLPPLLLPPDLDAAGHLVIHAAAPAGSLVLAQTGSGTPSAHAEIGQNGAAVLDLPIQLAAKISQLSLAGTPGAGSRYLLDQAAHARLIGLAAGSLSPDTPFLGSLYFVKRALPPGSQVITGDLHDLIASGANVIILADFPLTPAQQREAKDWITRGGELIRFSGPLTATAPDALSPDPLLPGDRRLGGSLTWAEPQPLAPPSDDSPLSGMAPDPHATISRQVLADPSRLDSHTVWGRLADQTPLVLGGRLGKGVLISILTTANADWSGLALSGYFPGLLDRLIGLAGGAPMRPDRELPLRVAMNGFGELAPAAEKTALLSGAALPGLIVSPEHPPGLYGEGGGALALNLGGHISPPVRAVLPGAETLGTQLAPLDLGGWLIGFATLLLCLDLTVSLILRGLLAPPRFPLRRTAWLLALACCAAFSGGRASPAAPRPASVPSAALQTELAYIKTGDPASDQLSADALRYLSMLVSARTSAQLGSPAEVSPDSDDLGLFALVYWRVLASAPPPSTGACAALNRYMRYGGLLVIDTAGSGPGAVGSGAGFEPGADAALAQATSCLALPPLTPLTTHNAIAHSFYIIPDFPGRFTGPPVLIASEAARDADDVTPIIIGQNDWAGAWARDATGTPEQMPLPGGDDQRITADRFGVNLVMYALTGNYKSDQSRLPAFLEKLGQ